MGASSLIFYLFMFTFLAALAWAGWQVFRTNESQERHGDDKKALTHRLEREQAEVEKAHDRQGYADGGARGLADGHKEEERRRMEEKQAKAEVERERHTGAVNAT